MKKKSILFLILIVLLSIVQQVYALGNIDYTPITTEAQEQEILSIQLVGLSILYQLAMANR